MYVNTTISYIMVYNRKEDKYLPVVSAMQDGVLIDTFNDWKSNIDDKEEWDVDLTIRSSMPLYHYQN